MEEPQAVAQDGPAERPLVHVLEVALAFLVTLLFERRLHRPLRLVHAVAEAAREVVAAALRHGVDHAAGKTAKLGRDAGREDLDFLDGVFDEQVVGAAEQIVGHVHTVDQELVVERERAADRHLARVRRVVRQARREVGDALHRPRGREGVNLLDAVVGAARHRGDKGGQLGRHGHHFGERRQLHPGVHPGREPEVHALSGLDRPHAGQLEHQGVFARRKAAQRVHAVPIGDRRTQALKGWRRHRDGHAWKHEAVGVGGGAREDTRLNALAVRRARHQHGKRDDKASGPFLQHRFLS